MIGPGLAGLAALDARERRVSKEHNGAGRIGPLWTSAPVGRPRPPVSPPRRWSRMAWTPAWLERRPKPLRIATRSLAILLLTLFAIWLVLFITKGRFLKGPFERFATSQFER